MPYVINHPEMGIYLGNCFGLGFWTKLDPVGQTVAVTFETPAEAQDHIATWDSKPLNMDFVEVFEDDAGIVGSIQSCVNAGLDAWEIENV